MSVSGSRNRDGSSVAPSNVRNVAVETVGYTLNRTLALHKDPLILGNRLLANLEWKNLRA